MSLTNYTLSDLLGTMTGVAIFTSILLAPGYVIGWAADVFEFRRKSLLGKFLSATLLSISLSPILLYLLGLGPVYSVWVVLASIWAVCAVLLIRDLVGGIRREQWSAWKFPVLAMVVWFCLGIFTMLDLHVGDRLYMTAPCFDLAVRTEITHAITQHGVRPPNPFFFPGQAVPLRYHHFWFLLCSLVERMGGTVVGPRLAIVAGTLWCGLGLMALVAMYLQHFGPRPGRDVRKRAWIGVLLLGVLGLDLIPVAIMAAFRLILFSPDLWNNEIAGWLHSLIWVPHHVAGVICCLTGFLMIWTLPRDGGVARTVVAAILTGAAFASATGTSVYVTFVFAVFVVVWIVICLWKRWYREAFALLLSGLAAAILASPYLLDLKGTPAASSAFIVPTIRSFSFAEFILHSAFGVGYGWLAVVNIALLPLNYFMEMGVFFLVASIQFRRLGRQCPNIRREDLAAAAIVATTAFMCTFFRSSVITNNDLGWRGFLIAQFIWGLWAIDYVIAWRRLRRMRPRQLTPRLIRLRRGFAFMLAVGFAGTAYEAVIARGYLPLLDSGQIAIPIWLGPDTQIGKRTFAIRQAYEWAEREEPVSARVLQNPNNFLDIYYGNFARRQAIAMDFTCGTSFGGSPEVCRTMFPPIKALFNDPGKADQVDVDALCQKYGISLIFVKDNDPSWRSPSSWVWRKTPIYANQFSRIFACSASVGGTAAGE